MVTVKRMILNMSRHTHNSPLSVLYNKRENNGGGVQSSWGAVLNCARAVHVRAMVPIVLLAPSSVADAPDELIHRTDCK